MDINKLIYNECRFLTNIDDKLNISTLLLMINDDSLKLSKFIFGNLNYDQSVGLFKKESEDYQFHFLELNNRDINTINEILQKCRESIKQSLKNDFLEYLEALYNGDDFAVVIYEIEKQMKIKNRSMSV